MKENENSHPNRTLSKLPITITFCLSLAVLFVTGCDAGTADAGTASNCNNFELGCYEVSINGTNGACSDAYSCDANNETKPFCSISRAIQCVNNYTTPINAKIRTADWWSLASSELLNSTAATGRYTLNVVPFSWLDSTSIRPCIFWTMVLTRLSPSPFLAPKIKVAPGLPRRGLFQ